MEKTKNKWVIPLIILLVLLFSASMIYNLKKNDNENISTTINNNEYVLLSDYSRFFTVNSCVYKFVNYLQKQEYEKLLEVLNKDFVSNNNISASNLNNFFPNLNNGTYSYVSKKIYYKKETKNIIKYYVYGYIQKETIDSVGEKNYYSYEVNFDTKNQTFDIAPYIGDLFKEEQ